MTNQHESGSLHQAGPQAAQSPRSPQAVRSRTLELARMGMALALLVVAGKITVPLPPVPFALLTFAVLLNGMILGTKRGPFVQLIYLIAGLIGVPVFACGGGPGYMLMPSFGYILGFIAVSWMAARLTRSTLAPFGRESSRVFPPIRLFAALIPAVLMIYVFGLSYMVILKQFYFAESVNILATLQQGMLIFLPTDFLQMCLAALCAFQLHKAKPELFSH